MSAGFLQRAKRGVLSRVPALEPVQRFLYRFKPYRWKFEGYYRDRGWGDGESVSGKGSSLVATARLRELLPPLLRTYGVTSLLDVPCGDFHWMKEVDLSGIRYLGGDIVEDLVEANTARYAADDVAFRVVDLLKDDLPAFDLVLVRDCLGHYDFRSMGRAIANLARSGSTYLLTTTFPGLDRHDDLEAIGLFRPFNLELAPMGFPEPLAVLDEGGTDGKALALWRLADLPTTRSGT